MLQETFFTLVCVVFPYVPETEIKKRGFKKVFLTIALRVIQKRFVDIEQTELSIDNATDQYVKYKLMH